MFADADADADGDDIIESASKISEKQETKKMEWQMVRSSAVV